jgi:hypothetical protein
MHLIGSKPCIRALRKRAVQQTDIEQSEQSRPAAGEQLSRCARKDSLGHFMMLRHYML